MTQVTQNNVQVTRTEQQNDVITRFHAPKSIVTYIGEGSTNGFTAAFTVDVKTPTGREITAGTPIYFHHVRQLGECSNLLIIQQ